MNRTRNSRRSFLLSGLAVAGGALLAGCGGEPAKEFEVTKQEDPMKAAQDSMNFYKNSQKKGAAKK